MPKIEIVVVWERGNEAFFSHFVFDQVPQCNLLACDLICEIPYSSQS